MFCDRFAARCALVLACWGGGAAGLQGQTSFTLLHGGIEREYLLSLPDGWDGVSPAPLLFSLHGGGGTNTRVASDPLAALASSQGYIGVYPQGYEKSWNDGRATTAANMAGVDDVGFFAALIDTLADTYAVDSNRIYATGTSNGGTMSYRLAAELNTTPDGNRLAGIAPTSANMPIELLEAVDPHLPVHVLMMVGTADPLMPFEGGTNSGEGLGVLSSAATRDYWLGELGIDATQPTLVTFPDVDLNDSSTVTAEFYDGAPGTDLAYYVVEGGGHAPPGGNALLAQLLNLGPVNGDIAASEEILDFFATRTLVQPLPGDFNLDGTVDAADYSTWRDGLGSRFTMADYATWQGSVSGSMLRAAGGAPIPEPAAGILLLIGAFGLTWMQRTAQS